MTRWFNSTEMNYETAEIYKYNTNASQLNGKENSNTNNNYYTIQLHTIPSSKPTRCTNFSSLFWNKILHVSDSSSVHHQEFFTVHTAMVYVIQVC
jgi:hypothetical protein